MSAAIAKPPGRRRCSATKRAHTASSSGRSTWQDTTAYRSRLTLRRLYRHPYVVLAVAAGVAATRSAALRARRDSGGVHGQERRLRPHVPRERHVRLHPGSSLRVHAAALRLLPDSDLLDRSLLGDRRSRPHRRRDRHGVDRLCHRPTDRVAGCGPRWRPAGHAPSVPRLARRPSQSRDPRPTARGRRRADGDPRGREGAIAVVGRGSGRDARTGDPRQCAAGCSSRSCSASG